MAKATQLLSDIRANDKSLIVITISPSSRRSHKDTAGYHTKLSHYLMVRPFNLDDKGKFSIVRVNNINSKFSYHVQCVDIIEAPEPLQLYINSITKLQNFLDICKYFSKYKSINNKHIAIKSTTLSIKILYF